MHAYTHKYGYVSIHIHALCIYVCLFAHSIYMLYDATYMYEMT